MRNRRSIARSADSCTRIAPGHEADHRRHWRRAERLNRTNRFQAQGGSENAPAPSAPGEVARKRLVISSDGMLIKETYFGEVLKWSRTFHSTTFSRLIASSSLATLTAARYTERMRQSMRELERLAPQTLQRATLYQNEEQTRSRDLAPTVRSVNKVASKPGGRGGLRASWRPTCRTLATPGGACSRLRRCSRQQSFTCSRAPAPRPERDLIFPPAGSGICSPRFMNIPTRRWQAA